MNKLSAVVLLLCLSATWSTGLAKVVPSLRRDERSDDVPPMQAVLDSHSQQLTQQDARITQLQSSLAQVQQQLQQHTDLSNQLVAFHARLNSDANLDRGDTFKFDNVISNLANGYDPQSGIFTAPVSGVYVFIFSTHGSVVYRGNAYLVVNGQNLVFVDDNNEQATGHGVFHLNHGERVWVASNGNNVHSYRFSTYFTGFLLSRDW